MKYVKFENLFQFQKKSKIKAGDGLKLFEGKYPFYTSSDTLTKSINEYLFDNESLIFGTGGQASIHYCNEKFAVSTDCFVTQPKNSKEVFLKYIYYYLSGNIYILENGFKGAGLKHISKDYLRNIQIPLPPLPQQQKIANILDAADALRQNDKALIAKYDELTQALFLDMFGDPVSNPKGWDQLALKHFGKISTGNTPSRSEDANYSTRHIEWIKTDNIKENYLYITQASEYLSEVGLKKARTVEKDAILVACIAGSIDSIGRAALTDRKVSFNQQINAIESNSNVRPKYLYYLIRNCKKHIQNHASNGMKRMLTKGEFEKIVMILPPFELQNQFAERVAVIEEQKAIAQKSLEHSESLFNSLLQKAFKGELV
jgi:type I restriction enzyme S subunit